MEKISLPFFYDLGKWLNPLTKFNGSNPTKRFDITYASLDLQVGLFTLFYQYPDLAVCRQAGTSLNEAIDKIKSWIGKNLKDDFNNIQKPDPDVDRDFQYVIDSAKKFEVLLSEELKMLATYYVTQKGIYSTSDLISRAENTLPPSVLGKINEKVKNEIRESGRCLAFDTPTASGFHIMRATEGVIHQYYLAVCKPKPAPARLGSWGAYFSKLKKMNLPDVEEVLALLQQIKDLHRNLIMHPEIVLSFDEAYALFEIAKSAIIAMASRLP